MKKILYISQYFPPETGAGATRSEAMVKYLTKLGWDIEVISELPNYPTGNVYPGYKKTFHQADELHSAKINRVWVWANPRRNFKEQIGIFGTFLVSSFLHALRKPKDFDIVYASSPPILAGVSGALISKVLRAKFVLEIRDIWPDAAVETGHINSKSLYYRLGRRIELWLYNQADLIIPVTTRSESIIKGRVPNAITKIISNGVDLSIFANIPNAQELVDEPYDNTKFRVGYVGSLGVIHDLETFVKAARLCNDDPDIEFIIVGDGQSRKKLEAALKNINPSNISWLGLKNHRSIPAYISSFDVAVNPVYNAKIFESIMTVKLYEYLACEVPVISLAKGLMKEEGDKSKAVITHAPEDAEALAKSIKHLKKNPEELNSLREGTRSYIINGYSREKLAEELSETLKAL